MKKKILFGLGAMAIAFALTFNVSIAKSNNTAYLDLSVISNSATAQAEGVWDCCYSYSLNRCIWSFCERYHCSDYFCYYY